MPPTEKTSTPSLPINQTQVDATARQLYAEHGAGAVGYALERIIQENADGHPNDAAFWQAVSRALVDPGMRESVLWF